MCFVETAEGGNNRGKAFEAVFERVYFTRITLLQERKYAEGGVLKIQTTNGWAVYEITFWWTYSKKEY